MVRVKGGIVQYEARFTEYNILGDTLARRTFDESGDYTVRPFQFDVKRSLTQTVDNERFAGVYSTGATTDDENTASESLLALACSNGKAYVRGYEIEKITQTFKDVNKARDFQNVNVVLQPLRLVTLLK